jgi:endonuclease G
LRKKFDPQELAREIRETAEAIEQPAMAEAAPQPKAGPESIIGLTYDFVSVSFLSRGRTAADAVARIIFRDGRPQGSGFLVAPGLLLTNQHVIASASVAPGFLAEFDFETDDKGGKKQTTVFEFDARFFVSDPKEGLDYALVALGPRFAGSRPPESFGFLPLSAAGDKHMLGEVANIIQHPKGRRKEVVLRENRLVSRLEPVLHYIADTEGGSSGSPVFNNDWQVIALHHWGGPGPLAVSGLMPNGNAEVNEGVRISKIVADLDAKRRGGIEGAARLASAIEIWSRSGGEPRPGPGESLRPSNNGSRPMSRHEIDLSDRRGYEPGFIRGFNVPLPKLTNVRHEVARNLDARHGEDEFELPYHHFSIVMNADRRLPFFTACNIDGKLSRHVDRRSGMIDDDATLRDRGLESAEAAEAGGGFRLDPRVHREHQLGTTFYAKQKVPGFQDVGNDRTARMFQKGHITLRSDPAWGDDEMTLAAEKDTYFYTNIAPQFGFFNQGSRDDRPAEKGKLRWRAVETYVLRNAVTMQERVNVFAGPVFRDKASGGVKADPLYRGVQIPMQFWKIVVWDDDGTLRSLALLAEQRTVLEQLTNGMPEALGGLPESLDAVIQRFDSGPERFNDPAELRRVQSFLSSVEEIGKLTGLVFDEAVKNGDMAKGRDLRDLRESVGDTDTLRDFLRTGGRLQRQERSGVPSTRGCSQQSTGDEAERSQGRPEAARPAKEGMMHRCTR